MVVPCSLLLATVGCDRPTVSAQSQPASPVGEQIRETTFDDLKFEMEKEEPFDRSLLTPQIEELFGQRIRIRGYMYPTLKRRGLTGFVLVRDNQQCCFGPGAALYDCIRVAIAEGSTAEYSIRPIAVEGHLRFDQFDDLDGKTRAIYFLESSQVQP